MNNKQAVSAALSALTAAAMSRCATTDLPALLELHNATVNAVSALRDDGPLVSGGSSCAESLVSTLVADETPALILAELRKHTDLLSEIASGIAVQGARADLVEKTNMIRVPLVSTLSKSILEDEMKRRGVLHANLPDADKSSDAESGVASAKGALTPFNDFAAAVTAAAEKRFAADPFAPTFEMLAGEDAVTVKLYPRPGSVQYIVNVTGPRSSAVRMEGGLTVADPRLAGCGVSTVITSATVGVSTSSVHVRAVTFATKCCPPGFPATWSPT